MRKLLWIFLFATMAGACSESAIKTTKLKLDDSSGFITPLFSITEIDTSDFGIVRHKDTTFYLSAIEEGIDGKRILFDPAKFKSIVARARFRFGFMQYTNDDTPTFPLKYSKSTDWHALSVTNGLITIPDFAGNTSSIRTYEILNMADNIALEKWVIAGNITQIHNESYRVQQDFYNKLLVNKRKYTDCCPEYIAQAETFLKKDKISFKTTADLSLELVLTKIEIEITGILKNGTPFRRVILDTME